MRRRARVGLCRQGGPAYVTVVRMSLATQLAHIAGVALGAATGALAPAEYDRELFATVARVVGFDVGILKRGHALSPACPGLDARVVGRCSESWGRFSHELSPVFSAARSSGEVAVDVDVLGRAALERLEVYRRLMRPHAGSSTAMLCLPTGRGVTLLALGRCDGGTFKQRELALLRRFVPVLALAELRAPPRVDSLPKLTPRERELLEYLPLGYSNDQIASAFGTAARTVRNQLTRLYQKLGVANRAEAVGRLHART